MEQRTSCLLLLCLCVGAAATVLDHRFFLTEIFNKYGHDGVISYEGLEHLLASLGLGRLRFAGGHGVGSHRMDGSNGSYEELHVAEHTASADEWPQSCLSVRDILVSLGEDPQHPVNISPGRFLHLCPVIIYQLDWESCKDPQRHEQHPTSATQHTGGGHCKDLKGQGQPCVRAWVYATVSIIIISLSGVAAVVLVPACHHLVHFLMALAVGTLCGDALMHLLPHALIAGGHEDHATIVWRAALAFLALTFFFVVESFVQQLTMPAIRAEDTDTHTPLRTSPVPDHPPDEPRGAHGHSHVVAADKSTWSTVACMVIMGDALHNLTDGLAIGTAYGEDTVAGLTTAIAVFCHELPHEIGDFAVLLKSGMGVKTAIYYNIVSSVLSLLGMCVGVFAGNHVAALWIYAATAGTFLYIALSDMVPEINRHARGSNRASQIFVPLLGMLTGGAIMLVIALQEHRIQEIFN